MVHTSQFSILGGGNSNIFLFSLLLGEMIQFDYGDIFQMVFPKIG